jgi:hypothetical protein
VSNGSPLQLRSIVAWSRRELNEGVATMETTRTPRQGTDDESMQHDDDMRNAPLETDWRRITATAHDKIAHRAHQLYEARGREPGHDMEDWLQAEHDIEEHDAIG